MKLGASTETSDALGTKRSAGEQKRKHIVQPPELFSRLVRVQALDCEREHLLKSRDTHKMTMEQEQQQRRAGDDDGNNDVDRRRGGAADADAETADAGVARPPRPAPSLHRALPSDPDLAARVRSVPDSAAEEVNRLLLLQLEAEKEKGEEEKETTAALVREFLSSPNADATVNRFLRAVGGKDAKAAVARLVSTLRWRKEANPGERSCEECKKDPRSHYMHVCGADSLGRPVIYSVLSLARGSRDVASNTQHMTSVFEGAVRMMERQQQRLAGSGKSSASLAGSSEGASAPPSPVPSASSSEGGNSEAALVAEQWIWVSDMHGFAAQDLDPRIARSFMGLLATHYPERLARFVIVGAPALFSALWTALKRHVCADTAAKIAFVKWDGSGEEGGRTAAELAALGLGGKLGSWLLREMGQNRDAAVAKGKQYPYGRAHELKAVVDGHDLRGTDEHVAMLEGSPRLVPGAELEV